MRAFNATCVLVVIVYDPRVDSSQAELRRQMGTHRSERRRGWQQNPTSMTVTQDDKTITLVTVALMGEIKTVFNLDGTQVKSPIEIQGMSIDRVTKSASDGNKLVLTTVSDFRVVLENKQIWTLGADRTMTVDSTRPDFQGGGAPITAKLVYKKQ